MISLPILAVMLANPVIPSAAKPAIVISPRTPLASPVKSAMPTKTQTVAAVPKAAPVPAHPQMSRNHHTKTSPRRSRSPRRGHFLGRDRLAGPNRSTVAEANHAALLKPTAHGFLGGNQIYPYAEGSLYQLYAAPERVSDIVLGSDETLIAVAAGDTVRWVIGDTTSGSGAAKRTHILVKPSAPGLHTNLVITTSQRSYHLDALSTSGAAMAALSWDYPQDQLLALHRAAVDAEAQAPVASALALDRLNFAYAISGDKPAWRPVRAFDDGRQVFVEFPQSLGVGEAPPLFVVGANGEAELVNYRVRGNYYVVDRLFAAAELRLGTKHQDVVRIIRSDPTRKGKRERGQ